MNRLLLIAALLLSCQSYAYDENHLRRFKAINKCPGCDFSGADLTNVIRNGAYLANANLAGVTMKGVWLMDAIFYRANLEGANLVGAKFSPNIGIDFGEANLQGTDLSFVSCLDTPKNRINFRGANLSGANLKKFQAGHSDFTDADLSNTNMEEGDFSRAVLCRTKTPWGIENIGCK